MASADTAPSGSTAGTAEDVQKVMNAAAKARLAGTEGAARFSQHWEPEAELQVLPSSLTAPSHHLRPARHAHVQCPAPRNPTSAAAHPVLSHATVWI